MLPMDVFVERFLKELCLGFLHSQDQTDNSSASRYIFTRDLAPSHPVLLMQHEALTISQSQGIQESFRKWDCSIHITLEDYI
jgi:DNA mismatch repair protein MLH3